MSLVEKIKGAYEEWSITPASELISYAEKCDNYALGEIDSEAMQNGICEYMDRVAGRARALSQAVGRTKEPPLADVFTEATNMLVDAITRSSELSHLKLEVFSEKNLSLPNKGGYRKPDVSLWKNGKLVCVVECKTCLGRQRDSWLHDYEKRAQEFSSVGLSPEALFLFVETEQTWCGFPSTDDRTLKTWFTLCPKGSWHGGGKTGEVKLQEKQHPGIIEKFKSSFTSILLQTVKP
jgi:hypothetical protein